MDEYAVYNAVLEHRFENGAYTDAELILLDEHTDFPLFSLTPDLFKFPNDTVSEPWWSDFSSKNHSHSTLGRMFKLSKPYLLVQSDYGFKHDLNIKLRDLNVNGTAFLQFSRVGFNSAKDEAVVHLGSYSLGYSEPPIGFEFGRYIFLKKINQIWIIIREQDTFIS